MEPWEALTQFQTALPHRSGLLQEAYWHGDFTFSEAGDLDQDGGKIRLD